MSKAEHDLTIEKDHARLADLAGRIRKAIESAQVSEVRHLCLLLAGIYEAHFRYEEEIMARVCFPELAAHRRAHRDLSDTLERINQLLTVENLPGVSRAVADHIESTLRHTIETDREFVQYAERN